MKNKDHYSTMVDTTDGQPVKGQRTEEYWSGQVATAPANTVSLLFHLRK